MNVYQKLQEARIRLQATKIKETGHNKFAGYFYLTLDDFMPTVQKIFQEVGLCGIVSYTAELATLTIVDMDGVSDGSIHHSQITITSPMSEANLKGCHPIQNVGACETYQRRYLWVTAMEIVEHDVLDATMGVDKPASMKTIVANDLADASDAERQRLMPIAARLAGLFELGAYGDARELIQEASKGDPTQKNILRGLGDPLHWKAYGAYHVKLKADATKAAQYAAVAKMNAEADVLAIGGEPDFN